MLGQNWDRSSMGGMAQQPHVGLIVNETVSFLLSQRPHVRSTMSVARHTAGVQQILMGGKKRQEGGRDRKNA